MGKKRGTALAAVVTGTALVGAVALAGCDSGTVATPAVAATPAGRVAVPPALEISPPDRARSVPASAEIGIRLAGARLESVRLSGAGRPVRGALREDGSAWVPAAPLAFGARYTATVTATDGARTLRRRSTFTTMAKPHRETGTGLYLFSGETYGVGMPVVVEFDPAVPPARRAAVQRRLFVRSDPPQTGAWHWFDGRQVLYRPAAYWRPGTVLTVRAALRGLPMGGGRYGDTDRAARVRIGRPLLLDIDNRTKRLRVFAGDRLLRRIPVSLGKPSTPSSSGRMVIMSKEYATIFDTRREGPDGYRMRVRYAQRMTWGGEFIHAAGWSVGDQGRRNVSHGCVNISPENAAWLFARTHVGDPITVRGTGVPLAPGNGWTVWDLPWSRYVHGSALTVRPLLPGPRAQ
jgi:lipoprotein-anchoring transpeptidase ErfK/SrfK